MTIVEKQ